MGPPCCTPGSCGVRTGVPMYLGLGCFFTVATQGRSDAGLDMGLSVGTAGSVPRGSHSRSWQPQPGPGDIGWSWGQLPSPSKPISVGHMADAAVSIQNEGNPGACPTHILARTVHREVLDTLPKPCILRSEDKEKAVLQPSAQSVPVASRGLTSNGRTITEKPFISTLSLSSCPGPSLFHPSTHGHTAAGGVGGQDACQADVPKKRGGFSSMSCPSSHPCMEDVVLGAGPFWEGSMSPSLAWYQESHICQLLLATSICLSLAGTHPAAPGVVSSHCWIGW